MLAVISLWSLNCTAHFGGGHLASDDLYTARSFLVGVEAEEKGYGLYSYLLFSAPPISETKERYEAAVRAFLAHAPIPAMQAMLPKKTLNIFYLMLMDQPPNDVARCLLHNCYPVRDADVNWILAHYNYARAQILLSKIYPEKLNGPIIASFIEPVLISPALSNDQIDRKILFQNLSSVPPHLVRMWVDVFIENATGEESSFKQDLQDLMLHLWTALENYAHGLPEVLRACKKCLDIRRLSALK
jgi:hypothetical protein